MKALSEPSASLSTDTATHSAEPTVTLAADDNLQATNSLFTSQQVRAAPALTSRDDAVATAESDAETGSEQENSEETEDDPESGSAASIDRDIFADDRLPQLTSADATAADSVSSRMKVCFSNRLFVALDHLNLNVCGIAEFSHDL